jgi:TetR/AcrR family transcriptional regulator, transcriptional repressor for nem operon
MRCSSAFNFSRLSIRCSTSPSLARDGIHRRARLLWLILSGKQRMASISKPSWRARRMKTSRRRTAAAFGDKHGLFLRALDRYIDEALARLDTELDPRESALAGLRACVAGYIEGTSGVNGKRGCLVVATAMELAAHDAEVERRIRRFFKVMETRLTTALMRAQTAGELAAGVEPAAGAHMLLCLLEGLRVVGKTGQNRAASQAAADTLLDRLVK